MWQGCWSTSGHAFNPGWTTSFVFGSNLPFITYLSAYMSTFCCYLWKESNQDQNKFCWYQNNSEREFQQYKGVAT